MANSYMTYGATFNPFTYDQLVKPLQESTQAHMEVEKQYAQLETDAAQWEKLALNERDAEMYEVYKSYADDLRAKADNLATNGLRGPSTRKDLYGMATRYAQDIVPIEQAWKAREEMAKEQQKIRNNTKDQIEFSVDAATAKLSDFYKRDLTGYSQVGLDDTYKAAATSAHAISSRDISFREGTGFGDKFLTYQKSTGYDNVKAFKLAANLDDELSDESISRLAKENPSLAMTIQNIKDRYNFDSFTSEGKRRIANSIIEGVIDGIVHQEDKNYVADPTQRGTSRSSKQESEHRPIIRNLYSQKELSDNQKKILDYIDDGYLAYDSQGNIALTQKGLDAFKKGQILRQTSYTNQSIIGASYQQADLNGPEYAFHQFVSNNGTLGKTSSGVSKDIKDYLNQISLGPDGKGLNDVSIDHEFGVRIDNNSKRQVILNILGRSMEGDIKTYDWDGKNKMFVDTQNDLSRKDVLESTVVDVNYSRYGNTAIIIDPKGVSHRVMIPRGNDPQKEEALQNFLRERDFWGEALKKGEYTLPGKNGKSGETVKRGDANWNEKAILNAFNLYTTLMQETFMNTLGISKTEDAKYIQTISE